MPSMRRDTTSNDAESDAKSKVMKLIDPGVAALMQLKEGCSFSLNGGRLYFGVNEKLERDGSSVLVVKSDVICQVPWKDGRIDGDVFVVNTRTHALLAWFVVADGVVRSIKRVKSVNFLVDISADGDRWEGEVDSQTGAICGWGEVYDRNNVLVYRGFRVNDENVAFGTFFHEGLAVPYYEGMHAGGRFMGEGVLHDRNGNMVREGVLVNGKEPEAVAHMTTSFIPSFFTSELEEVVLDNECTFDMACSWSPFKRLRSFKAQNKCFVMSRYMEFQDLPRLESVALGEPISYAFEGDPNAERMDVEEIESAKNRELRIMGCPVLQSITVGSRSMGYYAKFTLSDCPALKTLQIGMDNFPYSEKFVLQGGDRLAW